MSVCAAADHDGYDGYVNGEILSTRARPGELFLATDQQLVIIGGRCIGTWLPAAVIQQGTQAEEAVMQYEGRASTWCHASADLTAGRLLLHCCHASSADQTTQLHTKLTKVSRHCCCVDRLNSFTSTMSGRIYDRSISQQQLLGPKRPRPHKIWKKKFIKVRAWQQQLWCRTGMPAQAGPATCI